MILSGKVTLKVTLLSGPRTFHATMRHTDTDLNMGSNISIM